MKNIIKIICLIPFLFLLLILNWCNPPKPDNYKDLKNISNNVKYNIETNIKKEQNNIETNIKKNIEKKINKKLKKEKIKWVDVKKLLNSLLKETN